MIPVGRAFWFLFCNKISYIPVYVPVTEKNETNFDNIPAQRVWCPTSFVPFSLYIFLYITWLFYSTYRNILPTQNGICQNYERATFSLIYKAKARPNQPFTKLLYMCNHKIVMPVTENSWSIFLITTIHIIQNRVTVYITDSVTFISYTHLVTHKQRKFTSPSPPSIFTQPSYPVETTNTQPLWHSNS